MNLFSTISFRFVLIRFRFSWKMIWTFEQLSVLKVGQWWDTGFHSFQVSVCCEQSALSINCHFSALILKYGHTHVRILLIAPFSAAKSNLINIQQKNKKINDLLFLFYSTKSMKNNFNGQLKWFASGNTSF